MTSSPASTAASAWAPLRDARFRTTFAAFLGAQMVIWAQTVGAVDLLVEQSASAAAIAGIQTAISLPGVILALFAGALADVADRRLMLIVAGLSMAVAMSLLAGLVLAGSAGTVLVLLLTAALGGGLALFLPAFSAMVPDLVPRHQLAATMGIVGISVNVARATGPAIAGVLIAVAGAGGLFSLLALALVAVTLTLALRGPPSAPPDLPERIPEAVRAGARYARFSRPLRNVLIRTASFILFGGAMWALLPVIAVDRLGLAATSYGLLLACLGVGAVGAVTVMPRLRVHFTSEALSAAGTATFAGALVALTIVSDPFAAAAVLVIAGAAWISVLTVLMTAVHTAAPDWVRGRSFAAWLLVYQGGFAAAGVLWGVVAEWSLSAALLAPAGALALTSAAARLLPVPDEGHRPLEPARAWEDPVIGREVEHTAGPVMVTVEYVVSGDAAEAFITAMQELAVTRRRDGALRWNLYHDVADPERMVEVFVVATWGEHLRQHERGTHVDLPLEESVVSMARGYEVRHLVSAVGRVL
jgi:MFS family permease